MCGCRSGLGPMCSIYLLKSQVCSGQHHYHQYQGQQTPYPSFLHRLWSIKQIKDVGTSVTLCGLLSIRQEKMSNRAKCACRGLFPPPDSVRFGLCWCRHTYPSGSNHLTTICFFPKVGSEVRRFYTAWNWSVWSNLCIR